MTKRQAIRKVRELAQTARRTIIEECEQMIETKAVDLRDYDDDYALPKILITAAMYRKQDIYHPLFEPYRTTLNKLVNRLKRR